MIVAIDGPAGVGKSSVAMEVARRLGFQYVDTGAIYRTLAFVAMECGLTWTDGEAIAELAGTLRITFDLEEGTNHVYVAIDEGMVAEVTGNIRTPEISNGTSIVSAIPEVRDALLSLQRRLGKAADCVLEGRDIGTVVFPDAEVKIFFTATAQERAKRRRLQWLENAEDPSGVPSLEEIVAQIEERDQRDSKRAIAPLKAAPDAHTIDTTTMPFEAVVDAVVKQCNKKQGD